jgi:hypothetical protein
MNRAARVYTMVRGRSGTMRGKSGVAGDSQRIPIPRGGARSSIIQRYREQLCQTRNSLQNLKDTWEDYQ